MENCVFKKVDLENNTFVRVHITFEENTVKLIVLQNENAWKTLVTTKNLNTLAAQHKSSLEEYCEKLLEYVRTSPSSNVIFTFNQDEFVINRLFNNKLKMKYFTCKLNKVNYAENVEQIMDHFYSENSKYSAELNNITKAKNEIEANKTSCELALKELTEKKKSDEEELFGRFVLVLNEKKRRIQHLTELLEAFKSGRPTVNPPPQIKSRKRKTKAPAAAKPETVSESEPSEGSTSDADTDEEGARKAPESPKPASQGCSFLRDDEDLGSFVLPKRAKSGKSANDLVAPSASTAPLKPEEPQDVERSGSPRVDISTQQLLDML